MSLFLIPTTLVAEIERMLNGFWWGGAGGASRGIRWLSWEKLCVAKVHGGMGFRNLNSFNLALLGKQAWRLQTQPDLLVSRLYRAKYFPHSDFVHASKKSNGSFVWNSILASQQLLLEGSRWNIGNGSAIRLFEDRWTKDLVQPRPRAPGTFNPLLRVDYLIVDNRKCWNEAVVRFTLDGPSSEAVLATPLLSCVEKDGLSWRGERLGGYSVRSAYRLATQINQSQHGPTIDGNWGLLWKLKVPPKVKNFLWRLGRNCLPTRATLLHRGVGVPHLCPFCGDSEENRMHLFATCSTTTRCWTALGVQLLVSREAAAASCFGDWFFNVLQVLDRDSRCAWAMNLWSIWSSRNNLVWNNVRDSAATIVRNAATLHADWLSAKGLVTPRLDVAAPNSQARPADSSWRKPPQHFVKCNVDAAFDANGKRVGFGMCLRDDHGTFVAAKTMSFTPLLEIYKGEALGLLFAMEWVRDLQYRNVVFEMDAKLVVDDFNKASRITSDYGCILISCREAFSFFTEHSHVEFARREANKAAHTLAGVALLSAHSQSYFDVPACLSDTIMNEMH